MLLPRSRGDINISLDRYGALLKSHTIRLCIANVVDHFEDRITHMGNDVRLVTLMFMHDIQYCLENMTYNIVSKNTIRLKRNGKRAKCL